MQPPTRTAANTQPVTRVIKSSSGITRRVQRTCPTTPTGQFAGRVLLNPAPLGDARPRSNRDALQESFRCSELAESTYTNAERAFMNRRGGGAFFIKSP